MSECWILSGGRFWVPQLLLMKVVDSVSWGMCRGWLPWGMLLVRVAEGGAELEQKLSE